MMRTYLLAAAIALAAHMPAAGQTPGEPNVDDPAIGIPAEENAPVDCRAVPVEPDTEAGPPAELPDTSVLDECGGVLAPPVSADQEIVEPPTQGGETPVIDPSVVPPPVQEE